jgi:putative hydrolase of the HAD superfamily
MVGNSMKSDVVAAIDAGAWGVHVPAKYEWEMEKAQTPTGHPRFHTLQDLSHLQNLLAEL